MPRLLILCEHGTLNGGERSMLATLPGIARAGYDVCVAAPAAGPLAEALRVRGIEVIPFGPTDSGGTQLPIEDRRSRLAEILRALRPALLHANSLAMGRLSGPVAAELGVPSISHIRDIVGLSRQYVADLNLHHRLLAVSEATRRFHVDQGIAGEKTSVLYNGVDTEQFRPASPTGYLHEELGLPRDLPLIGTIGQISLRKGLDMIPLVLSLVPPESPFAWLIIGERFSIKDEVQNLERQLRDLAKGPFAGKLLFLDERNDVDRILPELTLLVHAARQEPLGRVLLEAAAAGRAIVATDVGGTREIFPSQCDAAYLVPPADPRAMAHAIGGLLGDPARRAQMGANARSRVESEFNVERATAGLLGYYENVLARVARP
jgi:glycosyltransferase involved in cell wall biosynthesis